MYVGSLFITTSNKLCPKRLAGVVVVVNAATSDETLQLYTRSASPYYYSVPAKYKTCLFVAAVFFFFFF